jgi:hypothetical protein
MSKIIETSTPLWKWPIDLERYDRTPSLFCFEEIVLNSWSGTSGTRKSLRKSLPRLYRPLEDVKNLCKTEQPYGKFSKVQTLILQEVKRTQETFWAWDQPKWLNLINESSGLLKTPLHFIAYAYLLGDFRKVYAVTWTYINWVVLAQFIFGTDLYWRECERLREVLRSIGYGKMNLKNCVPSALAAIMIENRNPYLDSFDAELLERTRKNFTRQARIIGLASHGLAALGVLPNPLRKRNYVPWKEKSTTGIAPEWADYCRRWWETSTLTASSRESNYSFTLRMGLWLARDHPDITDLGQWTVETCADFLAAVNSFKVGEWELNSFEVVVKN